MKNLSILMLCIIMSGPIVIAQKNLTEKFQKNPDNGNAVIKWHQTTYDFKKVEQLKPIKAVFLFENTGDVPLTIIAVRPQCGCTATDYPKNPILPGEKSKITLTYNASKKGVFNKSATVVSNSKKGNHLLIIKGEVQ
ncbi:DUF1573 domain-containing protein [Bacteroidota bacterium]